MKRHTKLACRIGAKVSLKEDLYLDEINKDIIKAGSEGEVKSIEGYGINIVMEDGRKLKCVNSLLLQHFDIIKE